MTTRIPTARLGTASLAASMALILAASPVAAQMFERAYSFTPRDRASLAVIMKQAENGMFERRDPQQQVIAGAGTGSAGTSSLNYTVNNLICGGDSGSANADGNSACIILNESTGTVGAAQDALGNQDATSSVETTENNGGAEAATTETATE